MPTPSDPPPSGPTVVPGTNFTATPTTGAVPHLVSFTDKTNPTPVAWSWNFGDGFTSTMQNPTHQYNAAGTFDVALVVTLPASIGLVFGPPFNAPTTNATYKVTFEGPVTASSTLVFNSSSLAQSYSASLYNCPQVFNGFTNTFTVVRQLSTIGVDWSVSLTVGGRAIRLNYSTFNVNPAYDNHIQILEGGVELYHAPASSGGVNFWENENSAATLSVSVVGTNLTVNVEYTVPGVGQNQIQFVTLSLSNNYSNTSTFLSNIYISSVARSVVPAHPGDMQATFNTFTISGAAIPEAVLDAHTKSALITTTGNLNPQLARKMSRAFEFIQETASNTWVIVHNQQQYPVIDIYIEYAGEKHRVLPLNVEYNDANTCTVTFSSPQTGFATVV